MTQDALPEDAQPPEVVRVPLTLGGVALVVLGSAAIGALNPWQWLWIVTLGVWVSSTQVQQWWGATHGSQWSLWLPPLLGIAICLSGFVWAIAGADGAHDRGLAVQVGLLVAWTGSEVLDGVLHCRWKRRSGT